MEVLVVGSGQAGRGMSAASGSTELYCAALPCAVLLSSLLVCAHLSSQNVNPDL